MIHLLKRKDYIMGNLLKYKALRLFSLLCALLTLSVSSVVGAQTSNGLGISPRRDYTIKAGDQVTDNLFVSNLSRNQDLTVNIRVVDFSAEDESGAPSLILDPKAPETPWSIRPFTQIQSTVKVAAGKSAEVPVTIKIPAGQGAGSYYSAIEFAAQNTETKQKLNISATSATLLFVTVPGDTYEQLNIKQFGTYVADLDGRGGQFKSWFFSAKPETLAYRLENKGNVAERPQGSILIRNMFGDQSKLIVRANPKEQLALINQTRLFDVCLEEAEAKKAGEGSDVQVAACKSPKIWPGRYTAHLDLFYGLNGSASKEIVADTAFWYLPWWFLVSLLVLILLLGTVVWALYRKITKRRRYRRR